MPRSKVTARLGKPTALVARAGLRDPLPDILVHLLFSLPRDEPQEIEDEVEPIEPPKKRVRHETPDPIVIARDSLEISRPRGRGGSSFHPEGQFDCRNAERYLKVQLWDRRPTCVLHVSSQSRALQDRFDAEIFIDESQMRAPLVAILGIAGNSKDREAKESGLWTNLRVLFDRRSETDHLTFIFELNWNQTTNIFRGMRNANERSLSGAVLEAFFRSRLFCGGDAPTTLAPQAFYEAAFVPDKDRTDISSHDVPHLVSQLYPFQCRAVQWLLNREGVTWSTTTSSGGSGVEPLPACDDSELPLSFVEAADADGRPFYLSDLFHIVIREIGPFRDLERSLRGGILAEEMGLGKTVETISLISMHRRSTEPPMVFDPYTGQQVRPTGATLIVTPATLKKQWASEFRKHAPGLRVMVYNGIKRHKESEGALVDEMAEQDVVLTTYDVLRAEIHFAEPPPDRAMRNERRYIRPKSPLVQLSWWRVCLDEAQQIESGVSAAAKVARLIPRINAWGITGTPVKENIEDLWGLLVFLHFEPYASYPLVWKAMTSTHTDLFKTLFHRIALRHNKRAVRNELELPPQKRYVITMPFTAVEEQNYQSQFSSWARNCGLDVRGEPIKADWDPDDPTTLDSMRRALAHLRQTILYPELGPGRLRALGQRNKPLRTIEEVLDTMIEQSESVIKSDQRQYLNCKLSRGQLLENSPRVKEALAIWQDALKEIQRLVADYRRQLQAEIDKAKEAGITEVDDSASDDSLTITDPNTVKLSARISDARRSLRSVLDLEHKAVFFIASAYFQIKANEEMTKPDSDEFKTLEKLEIDGYENAKQIRKEILQQALARTSFYMTRLQKDAQAQSFVEIPEFRYIEHKGLESRRVLEKLEKLCAVLDQQANLIDELREQVVQLLLRPLVDEEETEITGDEYEDSAKMQDSLMVYTLVLRATIADRVDAVTGQVSERTLHDTKYAERQAKDGEGPAPEKLLELLKLRTACKPTEIQGSLRGIVAELRELSTNLRHDAANGNHRANIELRIVQEQLKLTQDQITEQTKATTGLERELDQLFTSAMNARVEYYRQLQAVSDSVAPPEGEVDVKAQTRRLANEEASLQRKLTAAQAKHRYLLHLKEIGQHATESQLCIICQTTFTMGVLTICGHQFCKECITLWHRSHHNCPVCKKHLTTAMLHDITLKKQELKLRTDEPHPSSPVSPHKSRKSGIYSEFSRDKLESIRNVELNGPSFATKIDTMIRHLLWLRQTDPGAKSIIFSQFRDFLDVLSRAFYRYRIGFTSFDKKDGISAFKEDPAIECFLMDARAHASGLNLVNASHVFLCEPLLNTALELQAIARVDRIGQEHETTVWLYLVEGTVEESIYNLSVQRRMEHMGRSSTVKGKSKESTPVSDLNLEAANSMELQQAGAALTKLMSKDKQLGEVIDKNDIWECLFGHVAQEKAEQLAKANDERFENPAVVGFLAGEAAERRRVGGLGQGGGKDGGGSSELNDLMNWL